MSYENARAHAHQIVSVTQNRYMPPWLPQHGVGNFADELWLSPEQIDILSRWVAAGSPRGDETNEPSSPEFPEGWALGPPDLIVKADQPFRVPASGSDLFWNFVLKPQLTKGRFVRSIDIRPSNPRLVHHANLIVDRYGTYQQNFPGMDVVTLRSPLDLEGHFLFWKPGAIPFIEPDGFSWSLQPGNNLVLNMHLQPTGKEEMEQPSVAIYFTDKPPTHFPYLLQLEDDEALKIPAGDAHFVVSDSYRLPVDTEVTAIYPHAHYLGKVLEAWAQLPDRSRQELIKINDWNPNWQAVYRYRVPVRLPAGSLITMRYLYDNSGANPRNPHHPPQKVLGGNRATDEMAHLWLEVVSSDGRDSRRVYAETWAKHQLEKHPGDYNAELTLGALSLSRLHAQAAVAPLRSATVSHPDDAIAHNLYGLALEANGLFGEAMRQFEVAVQQRPDLANARLNLAHALARSGQTGAAAEQARAILHQYPDDPAALQLLNQLEPH
jgi:tetratricopeptide (TPR) repeat protein